MRGCLRTQSSFLRNECLYRLLLIGKGYSLVCWETLDPWISVILAQHRLSPMKPNTMHGKQKGFGDGPLMGKRGANGHATHSPWWTQLTTGQFMNRLCFIHAPAVLLPRRQSLLHRRIVCGPELQRSGHQVLGEACGGCRMHISNSLPIDHHYWEEIPKEEGRWRW